MNSLKTLALLIVVLFTNQSVTAAQQSDGDQKKVSENRHQPQNAVTAWRKDQANMEWHKRKSAIRESIRTSRQIPYDALSEAVMHNDLGFAEYLLEQRADSNAWHWGNGRIGIGLPSSGPIIIFAQPAMIKLLTDYKADANCVHSNKSNFLHSVVEAAYSRNYRPRALQFFKAGCDVMALNEQGKTALMSHLLDCFNCLRSDWRHERTLMPCAMLVKMGAPLNIPYKNEIYIDKDRTYQKVLEAGTENCKQELLTAIESAKTEVEADKHKRGAGLKELVQDFVKNRNLAEVILSYDDPQAHVVPLSLVREMDQLDHQIQAELAMSHKIESINQEIDKAHIDRALGLLPLLQDCGHFHAGPASVIHSYENPEDHILPLSLVREMEEVDKELEAEGQSPK